MSFAHLCGDLAPWAATIVFLSPIPTMGKIIRDKSVGTLPLLPYSTMICSTTLWTVYGVLKDEVRIWSANALGLVLGLCFFLVYIQYSPKASPTLPGTVIQHLQFMLAMLLATSLVATMSATRSLALSVIGTGGVIFCVAMFASPLSTIQLVLEKKSAKSIPLPFTVASFINCFLWTVFGWFDLNDINIYLPNILGLMFTIAQIALKLTFGDGVAELPR